MSELAKLDPRVIKYGREFQQDISAFLLVMIALILRPSCPPSPAPVAHNLTALLSASVDQLRICAFLGFCGLAANYLM